MKSFKIIPCPICSENSFRVVAYRSDRGRIVRCLNCSHAYLNPLLSDETLNDIYKKYYDVPEDAFMQAVNSWFRGPLGPYQYSLNKVEQGSGFSGKRVLDIGCGPGRFLYECYKRGAKVKGLDYAPRAIFLAKKYFGLNLSCGKIEEGLRLPEFSNTEFDFIFAFEIIEHLRNPMELLHLAYALLSPGGLFFLSVPNFHLFNLIGKGVFIFESRKEHLHFFEPAVLTRCLRQSGFEISEIGSLDPIKYGDMQKYRLLSNSLVRRMWYIARRFNFVLRVKNAACNRLNEHAGSADKRLWDGITLVAIARKPIV